MRFVVRPLNAASVEGDMTKYFAPAFATSAINLSVVESCQTFDFFSSPVGALAALNVALPDIVNTPIVAATANAAVSHATSVVLPAVETGAGPGPAMSILL
jgi:hypothetical protein